MNDLSTTPGRADWTIALSHGTLEMRDLQKARRFYHEFLGLETVNRNNMAIWVRCCGGWTVACVCTGERMKPLTIDSRWCLDLHTAEEVEAAHKAAHDLKDEYDIQEILPIEKDGDQISFRLADMDRNWWEICYRPGRLFDPAFEKAQAAQGGAA